MVVNGHGLRLGGRAIDDDGGPVPLDHGGLGLRGGAEAQQGSGGGNDVRIVRSRPDFGTESRRLSLSDPPWTTRRGGPNP
jgi:hypothetical protein